MEEKRDWTEIRVRGVNPNIPEQLHNIAKNVGMDFPRFMKRELKEIIQRYPENLRQNKG